MVNQLGRLEKKVSQRKRAFVRGRRGLNVQLLDFTRTVYAYLLEVNVYLTQTGETLEERLGAREQLTEAGEQLKEEVERWLAGE